MLTAEYLGWYLQHVKSKRLTVNSATANVYLWIIHKCLVGSGEDYILSTTCQRIADEINVSQPTVSRSLTELEKNRIIKRLPEGQIILLPPDIRWLEKSSEYSSARRMNTDNFAHNLSRANSGLGVSPPKGATLPKAELQRPVNGDVDKIVEDAQKPKQLSDSTIARMHEQLVKMRRAAINITPTQDRF